jgi:putative transposase
LNFGEENKKVNFKAMNYFPVYYHIYNRGVEKRDIFCNKSDYKRFIVGLREFNSLNSISLRDQLEFPSRSSTSVDTEVELREEKLVEIVAYCLNPNHYHLIVKEVVENGVAKFIQKLGTGYTNYFNKKYDRTGSLFQGRYKKVEIKENSRLLYLSAYARDYFQTPVLLQFNIFC